MPSSNFLLRGLTVSLSIAALASFAAGCGSDQKQASDEVPAQTPNLTLPKGSDALPTDDSSGSDTTGSDQTSGESSTGDSSNSTDSANSGGADTQSSNGTNSSTPNQTTNQTNPTTQQKTPTPTPAQTGGAQAPDANDGTTKNTQQPTTTNQNAPAKRFETFCQQNPGAC